MHIRNIFIGALLALVLSNAAVANTANVGAGYNFIPGSAYVSLGFRHANFGVDAFLISMGKEEPTVRPGPEFSLDALGYLPKYPVFAKLGIVAGWGKYGFNAGLGVDIPIIRSWFARLQDTYYRATEDETGGAESENLISLGLHYRF